MRRQLILKEPVSRGGSHKEHVGKAKKKMQASQVTQ